MGTNKRARLRYNRDMRLWITAPAVFLLTLTLAHAQVPATGSGALGTGSGSSSSVNLWPERKARALFLQKTLTAHLKRETQWRERVAAYRQKRADHRVACRAELRQSNRDTKLPTLLRCFRGELTMEREHLRQEKDYVAETGNINEGIRATTTRAIDLLRDAINTITFAIDNGVYDSQLSLTEAKRRLHVHYRAAVDRLRTLIRAEHALSWNALLLIDLDAEATGTGATVMNHKTCLEGQETDLRTILREGTGSTIKLTDVLSALSLCVQDLRTPAGTGSTTPTP